MKKKQRGTASKKEQADFHRKQARAKRRSSVSRNFQKTRPNFSKQQRPSVSKKDLTLSKKDLPMCFVLPFEQSLGLLPPTPLPSMQEQGLTAPLRIENGSYEFNSRDPKSTFLGPPGKQKIGVKKCWARESEIGEKCRQVWGVNFGREFWGGGPETLEKQGRNICKQKKMPSKFAENSPAIFHKFRQAKIKCSPQIRSAEPRDQHFFWERSNDP